MTIDNPRVRAGWTCPLCQGLKDSGLVVCWPCHRKQKAMNHGCYSAKAEATIEAFEQFLESQEQRHA